MFLLWHPPFVATPGAPWLFVLGEQMERKSLSKKTRFEVFKRDKFTCQYCGGRAPDVILHVDHVMPIAQGGSNDLLNLVTSCSDCNLGKGARKLSDDSMIEKQRRHMEQHAEREEQILMMLEWKKSLVRIDDTQISAAVEYFTELTGFSIRPEYHVKTFGPLIRKYGLAATFEAVDIAFDQYFQSGNQCEANKMLSKLSGIAFNKKREREDPFFSDTVLFVNTAAKRLKGGYRKSETKSVVQSALSRGVDKNRIWECLDVAYSLDNFLSDVKDLKSGEQSD